MKKSLVIAPFIPLLFFVLLSFNRPVKKVRADKAGNGFALVELFTSEGCSSCPPADQLVAALSKEYPSNVYVLCFHVDYWNYLGWKDEFSSADYTTRQQQYATAFNINSIYTPQAIVNGRTECTGSDRKKLYTAVQDALEKNSHSNIEISAKASGVKQVAVSYKTGMDNRSMLQLAIVQTAATSSVKRGENKGLLLHHINVVRGLKVVATGTGTTTMVLPEGLAAKDCRIIGFIQARTDLQISGAGSCAVQ
jgi:hypothetical protein